MLKYNEYTGKDYREYIHNYLNEIKDCILLTCDMFPRFDNRKYELIDIGLREYTIINFAIGLGLAGKKVFVYCPLDYIKLRSAEQLRLLDEKYNHLDITIIENYYGNPHNLE